jgi:hypothetical protein
MGFLQLTPENIAQARSLSYPEAFKLDQTYKFDPNFKGGVSRSKYIGEGLKSLIGLGDPNIGGATPLTRKIALDAADLAKSFGGKALNFLGKASIPLSVLSSTPLGADDMITQEMRDSIDTTGINSLRGDPAQFYGEDPFLSETRDYTDGELYDIDDTGRIPTITDRLKGGLGSIRDTVTDKLGSVGDFIKGGGILGQALKGLDNMFEYRGGIGYVDEDGVFRSADELDKLNARGGYYTDVARASRRRDASIQRMLQRKAEGKRIGEQRLKDLLEQQAKEEAARQKAFDKLNAIRQQRDADSMSGGPGETTQGTFGSSVNDSSTFSDYS